MLAWEQAEKVVKVLVLEWMKCRLQLFASDAAPSSLVASVRALCLVGRTLL